MFRHTIAFVCIILVGINVAAPVPVKFSDRIRKNWDKKGISYPKDINEAFQHPHRTQVPVSHALVSAPFRQSLGQGAWGRSWDSQSRVRIGDERSPGNSQGHHEHVEATTSSQGGSKKPRLVDWQSDHSFDETPLSNSDPDWSISSKEKLPVEEVSSSDESSKTISASVKGVSKAGSRSSIDSPGQLTTVENSSANSSKVKTWAHLKETTERNEELFNKVWKEPRLTLKLSPLKLAKNVRKEQDHGMKKTAFRLRVAKYVTANASPKYAAKYHYHATELRRAADRKQRRPHLPSKKVRQVEPTVDAIDHNWRRRLQMEALNSKIDAALFEHLEKKQLDYREMTLLELEEATRDFHPKDVSCGKKKISFRINELFREWKKPTAIEWHSFEESRKKYRDIVNKQAKIKKQKGQ
jgi:hypothetical protein